MRAKVAEEMTHFSTKSCKATSVSELNGGTFSAKADRDRTNSRSGDDFYSQLHARLSAAVDSYTANTGVTLKMRTLRMMSPQCISQASLKVFSVHDVAKVCYQLKKKFKSFKIIMFPQPLNSLFHHPSSLAAASMFYHRSIVLQTHLFCSSMLWQ